MKKTVPHTRRVKSLEDMKTLLRKRLPDLQRVYGITSMEIFGSWVRGEQTGRSDLDILIEFNPVQKISLFDLVSLEQELSAYLGVPIDLVEKSAVKPALRHRILNEAVPL
jgi:hypothetical protein